MLYLYSHLPSPFLLHPLSPTSILCSLRSSFTWPRRWCFLPQPSIASRAAQNPHHQPPRAAPLELPVTAACQGPAMSCANATRTSYLTIAAGDASPALVRAACNFGRQDRPHLEFHCGERRWKWIEMKKMVTSSPPPPPPASDEQNGCFTEPVSHK